MGRILHKTCVVPFFPRRPSCLLKCALLRKGQTPLASRCRRAKHRVKGSASPRNTGIRAEKGGTQTEICARTSPVLPEVLEKRFFHNKNYSFLAGLPAPGQVTAGISRLRNPSQESERAWPYSGNSVAALRTPSGWVLQMSAVVGRDS